MLQTNLWDNLKTYKKKNQIKKKKSTLGDWIMTKREM